MQSRDHAAEGVEAGQPHLRCPKPLHAGRMALLHAHALAGGVTCMCVGISGTMQAQRRGQALHETCQEQSSLQAQVKRV